MVSQLVTSVPQTTGTPLDRFSAPKSRLTICQARKEADLTSVRVYPRQEYDVVDECVG